MDQTVTTPPSQPVNELYLGPVQFGVGGYAGISYDDNVNSSQNAPEPDVILRTGVNLSLGWAPTDRSQIQLGAGIGYLDYQKFSGNNGLEISPDSALTYAISLDEVVLTFFDQLSYSRQVRTEAALANIVSLPQLDNNIGVRAEWDPGQWTLQTTYSHDDFVSSHDNDFLNRSSEYFTARAGWRFAPATQVGVEASDALTYYQVGSQNNNQNLSAGAYAEWAVRPSLQLTLSGGPVFYMPNSQGQNGGSSDIGTYYFSLEARHQLTYFLSHSLSVNRSLQAGLNQGGSYIEQLSINYSMTWDLTSRIRLTASASYVDGQQPLVQTISAFGFEILFPETENYQQYGGGLNATWKCTSQTSATLGFNHWLRDSNLSGRGYSDDSVSFQINYNF